MTDCTYLDPITRQNVLNFITSYNFTNSQHARTKSSLNCVHLVTNECQYLFKTQISKCKIIMHQFFRTECSATNVLRHSLRIFQFGLENRPTKEENKSRFHRKNTVRSKMCVRLRIVTIFERLLNNLSLKNRDFQNFPIKRARRASGRKLL